ncbi:MAG: hypothetical protein AL399_01965 [Candidatus [Bacteroides] periocalifornicus]|uniref:Nucleoside phosphorylase domain-containing protein n=1 Tax=Candidatus [Bacteroides] periocalifornicus TaxID=1702214 RepID=A0A0Q4B9Q0_9BACT|nr:MAG: hypothetical protein AL399_01965 [Candidatus [Bacteroides] periocalifornicus]
MNGHCNQILLVAATQSELEGLPARWDSDLPNGIGLHRGALGVGLAADVLITGVGAASCAALLALASHQGYELLVNVGFAGAIGQGIPVGELVLITHDRFADYGIPSVDSRLVPIHKAGFQQAAAPNADGAYVATSPELLLRNSNCLEPCRTDCYVESSPPRGNSQPDVTGQLDSVPEKTTHHAASPQVALRGFTMCQGITVSHPTQGDYSWCLPIATASPLVESMEGAAFALVASLLGIPRISLRVVSNYAASTPEWDVPLAKRELAIGVQRVISAYMGKAPLKEG